MDLSQRSIAVLVALLVLTGIATGAAIQNFTSVSSNADGTVLQAGNGPAVNVTGNMDVYTASGGVSTNQITWNTSAGNASFSSPGPTEVTVHKNELVGSWTNLTAIDTSTANLTVDPEDKPPVMVGGNIDTFSYPDRTMTLDDGQPDFVYSGASGESIVQVRGLPANRQIAVIDADSRAVLGVATTSGTGVATFRLTNSEHTVELTTTEGAPELSNPSPEGDQSGFPTELSIDVSDPDFPDDNVTVEFYLDGAKVGEETTTSDGTVKTTISKPSRGAHTVKAVATDAYDQTAESEWTFGVPNKLYARDVNNPGTVIDDREVTFRFVKGDDIVERSTTSGNVSLDGLNVDGDIHVIVESTGYFTRSYLLEDLSEQQSVYLLNDTKSNVFNVFTLNDLSGNYPPSSSMLIIQRPLNISGSTNWEAVAGGPFDAVNEFKTRLELDGQYRLIVKNSQGDKRVIGGYKATDEANPKILKIESIVVSPPGGQDYYGTAWLEDQDPEDDKATIRFSYVDNSQLTESLRIKIHERGNPSNVLDEVYTTSVNGSLTYSYTLTGNQTETDWVIDWSGRRDGETIGQKYPVGKKGSLPIPIDPTWLSRFGLVALPVFAALSSERIATLGAMGTVAFAGILMITGIWAIPLVLWFAAAVIAIGAHALTMARKGEIYG